MVTQDLAALPDNVTKGKYDSNYVHEWSMFQSKALRMIEAGNNQNFNFQGIVIPQKELEPEIAKIRLIEAG